MMIRTIAAEARPASVGDLATEIVVLAADDVLWARIGAALALPGASLQRAETTEPLPTADLAILASGDLDATDLAFLRGLRDDRSPMPVVVVCRRASPRTARRALDAGVSGLLSADRVEPALPPTVAAVLAGQTVVPAEFSRGLRRESLSFREKQILGLVVLGFTNGQIAGRLFLAESTVKSHLSSSFGKLGVASRSEAAALILNPHEAVGASILKLADELQGAGQLPSS